MARGRGPLETGLHSPEPSHQRLLGRGLCCLLPTVLPAASLAGHGPLPPPDLAAEPDPASLVLPGPPLHAWPCSRPRPRPLHKGLSFGVGVSTRAERWHLLLSHFDVSLVRRPLTALLGGHHLPCLRPRASPPPPPRVQRWVTVLKLHPTLAACDTRIPVHLGFWQIQPGFSLWLPSGQVCADARPGRMPCSSRWPDQGGAEARWPGQQGAKPGVRNSLMAS